LPAICLQTAAERSEEVKIQLHFNLNNGNLLLLTDGFCSRWCQKSLALFWGLGFVFFFWPPAQWSNLVQNAKLSERWYWQIFCFYSLILQLGRLAAN